MTSVFVFKKQTNSIITKYETPGNLTHHQAQELAKEYAVKDTDVCISQKDIDDNSVLFLAVSCQDARLPFPPLI